MRLLTYKNLSGNDVVIKKITLLNKYEEIFLKEDCDMLTPIFQISQDELENSQDINYVYVPKFGRYYFAHVKAVTGGIFEIICEIDVLRSFASDIRNSTQLVTRQEKKISNYLIDNLRILNANNEVVLKNFGQKITDNDRYIIGIVGGYGENE